MRKISWNWVVILPLLLFGLSQVSAMTREEIMAQLPEKILYVVRPQYSPDHHNTATLFQPGEVNTQSFTGNASLKIWFPKTDQVQTILTLPEGIVRDPEISFDAKRVIFSFRKGINDFYHIGEITFDDLPEEPITLLPDSSTDSIPGFRQITFFPGISDIDPLYLPDGKILFSSTREPKYCMCNRHIMCNLYTANSDGTNIEQIGKSTLFEGHSSLLPDGRILYDRWEYVDRNFGDAQGIWVANPDGTKHEIFWGNSTSSPGAVLDARILPGSDSVFLAVFGSCHNRPWGAIALVDRRLGVDGKESVLMTWPNNLENMVDPDEYYDNFNRVYPKFEDPYPITESLYLAAGMVPDKGEETGIYALTDDGDMEVIHDDTPSCFDPMPIIPKETPMAIADRIDRTKETGVFAVSDLYIGNGMEKIERGTVKYLRVVESPEKRFWTSSFYNGGNGTQAPGMAWDDFNNKRILGTVPVEEDGSVKFEVPAERFVYFQLLDKDKKLVQSMRSGIMVRPGETNACVGCHESRIDAPSSTNLSATALAGEPKKLEDWYGPARLFSYRAEVQPVFDRYCIACHDFGGPGAEKLNLAGDRGMIFCRSYIDIRTQWLVRVVGAGSSKVLPARTWGSYVSPLAKFLDVGHSDPIIDLQRKEMGLWFDKESDPESYDRIITWIDINAPYYPTYGTPYVYHRFGRAPITPSEEARLNELTGMVESKERFGPITYGDKIFFDNADMVRYNNDVPDGPRRTVDLSFDRPELSPCLNLWKTDEERQSPEYQEALAIILKGAERIQERNPGDDPNFVPVEEGEIRQQAKYDRLLDREKAVRKAILSGTKVSDKEF